MTNKRKRTHRRTFLTSAVVIVLVLVIVQLGQGRIGTSSLGESNPAEDSLLLPQEAYPPPPTAVPTIALPREADPLPATPGPRTALPQEAYPPPATLVPRTPLPRTPVPVLPTATPPMYDQTLKALAHIAQQESVPVERLVVTYQNRWVYELLGKTFWAVKASIEGHAAGTPR